ncbi:TonB-dependent receptor plug domain-containing protein [Aestuariivivens insulae]|uniref:TonB-dependent receptor plug domain-containing protein n=1 Tax=Aestuariivivens insulae TaxID=1621988 RepID=UPI001F5665D0|nr:TonB-dependent receptor plug domain-containing protein [Aestuariivivens insulae]
MKYRLSALFFFVTVSIIAQQTTTVNYLNTPLSEAFADLEKTFNVKFSFNSEIVNNRAITFNLSEATLDEILINIEEQLFLKFKKESNRYYTVKLVKKQLTDTQELDEVLIEEYITSGISNDKDDASVSISPEKLGILPGLTEPDVLQSIQLIPGVQSPSETASDLFIRGGTPDQNLILWDGIKMYHTGHFFGTISAFNPYITDQIKLYKSGTKAKYGGRIAGVIDIESDKTIPKSTEGGFGFNMTHTDAFIKAPLNKKTAVLFSARRSITDVFDTETFRNLSKRVFQETKISNGNKVFGDDEVTTTNDLFYFTDFTAKVIVNPNEKNALEVSSLYTKNKLDYGFLIEAFEEASQDKLDIVNQGISLNWKHDFNASFSHNFNAYYSNFDLEYVGTNSISGELDNQLDKHNSIKDFGMAYNLDWNLSETSSIGLGYQFSSNQVKYKLIYEAPDSPEDNFVKSSIETNNITHALYFDHQYKLDKKWFVNTGLRANYFSVINKFYIEPRLQLSTNLNPFLKFKVSGERLHQSVSEVLEFNTREFGLENQVWVLSDGEEIPILKSTQLTTGFVFSKNGWGIDYEMYYKKANGLTTLGFDRIEDFFFKGKSNVFGIDFLVKKKIQNYRTWLSYSLINNDFEFEAINDGKKFPGNTDITHNFVWSHTYEWNHFNVSLGWNIRTGIPFTKATGIQDTPDGAEIVFESTNSSRLPNYHRLDVSTTYTFNISKKSNWKGKLGLSLLNIYNRENMLSRTYEIRQSTQNSEDELREINKTSLGLTPNMVFRVEF